MASRSKKSKQDKASFDTLRDDSELLLNIAGYYNSTELSDIIVKVADNKYYGHKFVLAKSSDVFRTMLYDKAWAVGEELELIESMECEEVFDRFLRYLYTAKIEMNAEMCVGVLCLADKYNVTSLTVLCENYMIKNANGSQIKNALMWYPWTKTLNLTNLEQECIETVARQFENIWKSTQFYEMDVDLLKDVMESSEIVFTCEYMLYMAVGSWLLHDRNVYRIEQNAGKLLDLVRFPRMSAEELMKVEKSDLMTNDACHDLLVTLLNKAYRFRTLSATNSQEFQEEFYCSRENEELVIATLTFGYNGHAPKSCLCTKNWVVSCSSKGMLKSVLVQCEDPDIIKQQEQMYICLMFMDHDGSVMVREYSSSITFDLECKIKLEFNFRHKDVSSIVKVLVSSTRRNNANSLLTERICNCN